MGPPHKKPPTFAHYPKQRAQALKQEWVQRTKMKSKWAAEKRKLGLVRKRTEEAKQELEPEDASKEQSEEEMEEEWKGISDPAPAATQTNPTSSLSDLTRQAYSKNTLHTYKSVRRGGAPRQSRGGGQPNMKLRMGALLEKIKRSQ